MYESFYHLSANPFRLTPDPSFCFSHPAYQEAHAYLQYAFELGEGFILLTGRPGAGKTTLVESFLRSFDSAELVAARIAVTDFEASELLRAVAYRFNLEAEGVDKATLLRRIERFFASRVTAGGRVLLVIDEAQRLSQASLEELRLLADLQIGAHPLLQIFLVGQEALRAVMGAPEMEQLQQRVIGTCRLGPLGLVQTRSYVEHRLRRANWRGDPELSGAAVRAVYEYSKGVPRHINKICTRLLLQGYMDSKHLLDGQDVYRVASELEEEQLAPLAGGGDTGDIADEVGAGPALDDLAIRADRTPDREKPVLAAGQLEQRVTRKPASVRPVSVPAERVIAAQPVARPGAARVARSRTTAGAGTKYTLAGSHLFELGRMIGFNVPDRLAEKPARLFGAVAMLTLFAGTVTSRVENRDDSYPGSAAALLVAGRTDGEDIALDERTAWQAAVEGGGESVATLRLHAEGIPATTDNPEPAADSQTFAVGDTAPVQMPVPTEADEPNRLPLALSPIRHSSVDRAASGGPQASAEPEAAPHQDEGVTAIDTAVGVEAVAATVSVTEPPAAAVDDERQAELAVVTAVEPPIDDGGRLSTLLAQAEQALDADRLLIPSGNCAHDYYRQVLQLEPQNTQARQGIARIVSRYSVLARQAIQRGDNAKALRYIARGLRVQPGDARLLAMQDNLKIVAVPVVEPVPGPQELPPPVFEEPAKPGNILQRLKAFFADSRSTAAPADTLSGNASPE